MKKLLSIVLVLTFILCLSGCSLGSFKVPDVQDVEQSVAENILSSNGFIPSIKYEYNDITEEGNVIRTDPSCDSVTAPNSKITVYVSKGPSYVAASNSRAQWYYLSSGEDTWNFNNPYIDNGVLYINCYAVSFACPMKWQDRYGKGEIIGIASVTDTFDKTIPVSAKYEKQSWAANETQSFILEIPLKDLDTSKPTDMYLRLYTDNNSDNDVRINFFMSW